MKPIDKDAVVAEIEKRIKALNEILIKRPISYPTLEKLIEENKKVLSFLDTLEVKEVDLEKEYKNFVENDPVYSKLVNNIVGKAIAKHFFELGLKVKQQ